MNNKLQYCIELYRVKLFYKTQIRNHPQKYLILMNQLNYSKRGKWKLDLLLIDFFRTSKYLKLSKELEIFHSQ